MFNWFKITNLDDLVAAGIPSREFEMILGQYGLKTIVVFVGETFDVLVDDVFLMGGLNSKNPYELENRAVFIDDDQNLWVGFKL